ncbi:MULTISPECIES: hypothetical protein [unclassified Streptomyces]|uniref:hypothetical protein n=1 Tax=unclassified Streptomyces TaxID=2593676 RepID=UPI003317E896
MIVKNERMRKLCVPVVVNLLLGVPAIVPLFLAWYILANGPLAAIGWTMQDPNENDGMLLWLVIAAPVFCLFGLVWGLINAWLRRRTQVRGSRYWSVCAAASIAPFLMIFGLL